MSTRVATPTRYRTDVRRQSAIANAARAARAVPSHRKCNRAHPKACIAFGEIQLIRPFIAGSFRTDPAFGVILQFLLARPYAPRARASSTGWLPLHRRAATYPPQSAAWSARREGMLHRRAHVAFRFGGPCLLSS